LPLYKQCEAKKALTAAEINSNYTTGIEYP